MKINSKYFKFDLNIILVVEESILSKFNLKLKVVSV